jgi:hypothetical protein
MGTADNVTSHYSVLGLLAAKLDKIGPRDWEAVEQTSTDWLSVLSPKIVCPHCDQLIKDELRSFVFRLLRSLRNQCQSATTADFAKLLTLQSQGARIVADKTLVIGDGEMTIVYPL